MDSARANPLKGQINIGRWDLISFHPNSLCQAKREKRALFVEKDQ